MLFNSINFLIFFPIVFFIYFLIPSKYRYIWLLVASYYFYMCWNCKYIFLILFSTIVTYLSGIVIGKINKKILSHEKKQRYKKICVAISLILNLSILFFFKYYNFTVLNINQFLTLAHIQLKIPSFDILLPVGISFYTFQALSYTIDVYRGQIDAEKNIFRYALFVSFFPQLVAGPIERSKNLLNQIKKPTYFNVENAKDGLLTMAYGLFLKVVIADHISAIIDPIFLNYANYNGMTLFVATILFAFQIYCDFQGYSKLAIGSAKVLGFQLMENFDAPYLANSVKDFWRRWHISLTSWFRDYLYIPLGGNRKGKVRKYLNTMIIFLASGLWHGAGWHYVVWGGLNGFYIVLQDLTLKIRNKIYSIFKINQTTWSWKILQRVVTFLLVDFAWLFFRANSFKEGLHILKKIVVGFRPFFLCSDNFFAIFGSTRIFFIIGASLLFVLLIDVMKYKNIDIKECIFKQQFLFRWIIYISIILVILFGGAYGQGYAQKQFIYFQF